MVKAIINGLEVEYYDSIADLPITRYKTYAKMCLIDSGIGSEISDFDTHIQRAAIYEKTNPGYVIKELENLRQNVYFIQNEISPKCLAFAALVHSVNGEIVTDLSQENLKNIVEKLSGEKYKTIIDTLEGVKKK